MGTTTGAVGTYQISGGTLLVDNLSVGGGSTSGTTYGTGVFIQSSGTVNLTQSGSSGQLYVGNAAGSNGSYSLQGGSLVANEEFVALQSSTVGAQVGQRSFVQSGGTNTITGQLDIGYFSEVERGYTPSGGTNTLLAAANEYIGVSGAGSFTQLGGVNNVNTVNGFLILDNSGATGNYSLNAGTLTGAFELIGNAGAGTFTQSGGMNTATQAFDVVNGIYTLTSGILRRRRVYRRLDTNNVSHAGTFIQTGIGHDHRKRSHDTGFDIGNHDGSGGHIRDQRRKITAGQPVGRRRE